VSGGLTRIAIAVVFVVPLVAATLVGPRPVEAYSSGIFGRSGNPATNGGTTCNSCHNGGTAPTVTIAGPSTVAPLSSNTYALKISGGQEIAGGLDVSATSGTLGVTDIGTQLLSGEITHDNPRNAAADGSVTFTFQWTAPSSAGSATLYAAGNSVDLSGSSSGDRAGTASKAITVASTSSGPGEASGERLAPLRVTGFDRSTGTISISYDAPCGATDHAIVWGPLAQVSSYGWNGQACGIGISGTASFAPGPGNRFFVVVARGNATEGSYGTDDAGSERPPFGAGACGATYDLAGRCDAAP